MRIDQFSKKAKAALERKRLIRKINLELFKRKLRRNYNYVYRNPYRKNN